MIMEPHHIAALCCTLIGTGILLYAIYLFRWQHLLFAPVKKSFAVEHFRSGIPKKWTTQTYRKDPDPIIPMPTELGRATGELRTKTRILDETLRCSAQDQYQRLEMLQLVLRTATVFDTHHIHLQQLVTLASTKLQQCERSSEYSERHSCTHLAECALLEAEQYWKTHAIFLGVCA